MKIPTGCLTAFLGITLQAGEPAPAVSAVYPTAETLPANHLKFYLHFATPMETGDALARLQLIDLASGQPVPEPFRETELWDDARQRLTLWLHPGRQKTGVNLNEDLGPILSADHRYELRLAQPWPDAQGRVLSPCVLKTFATGPARKHRLDAAAWRIAGLPAPGSRAPLTVHFPAPLDHALLQRCLRVFEKDGAEPLPGDVQTGDHETSWSFTPRHPWTAASHELRVLSVLEDLAGNSLARPFEVDLAAPPLQPVAAEMVLPLEK